MMSQTLTGKLKWQLILFLARRLPDCKTITPKLGESMDRKLSFRERVVNRLHLFTCEACRRYREQIEFLHIALEATGGASEEITNASLSPGSKERLKKAVRSYPGTAS